MRLRSVLTALVVLGLAAAPARALDGRRLRVRDGRLVDSHRREVTLRGVNARADGIFDVTFDDGRLPLEPIPNFDDGDAARMEGFGFNLLRLPLSWSALEPEPGRFDDAYLDRVAAVVDVCRAHGVLVLLDLHQDAFSKEIGEDGAPRWVLDLLLGPNNYPYLGGPLTDLDARRFAPATLEAFRQSSGMPMACRTTWPRPPPSWRAASRANRPSSATRRALRARAPPSSRFRRPLRRRAGEPDARLTRRDVHAQVRAGPGRAARRARPGLLTRVTSPTRARRR